MTQTFDEWYEGIHPRCKKLPNKAAMRTAYQAGQRAANVELVEALGNALYFMGWAPQHKDAKRIYEKHLASTKGQDDE